MIKLNIDELTELIEKKAYRQIKMLLDEMNAVDAAEVIEELDSVQAAVMFRLLDKEVAADVFSYLDSDTQQIIINAVTDRELKEILDDLFVDDTVDLIGELPAGLVKRILKLVPSDERELINKFLKYEDNTAGSIMTAEFINLKGQMSVREAIEYIRRVADDSEDISTCFVIDKNRMLIGSVDIKTLILSGYDELIEAIMEDTPIYVTTTTDREEVARDFSRYDLLSMPVVDLEGRLVGLVTVDDAVEVMEKEATEDFEKMAAMSPSAKPYMKTGVFTLAKNRIVWLMLLMVSATITGTILASFEEALAIVPALVTFVPMLMDTGGNAGAQASTMIIRGMAVNEIELSDFLRVLWKEMRVGLLCGLGLGLVNFLRVLIFYNWNVLLALSVSLTLSLTVVIAKSIACVLPMAAKSLKLDPALMASPLITTLVDACSLLIYLFVAKALLL